jgi:hypothetical protein
LHLMLSTVLGIVPEYLLFEEWGLTIQRL